MVDFVKEDFQLAIRLGMGGWPNLWARKKYWTSGSCRFARLPCMQKHGPVKTADDLKRYPLLHSVSEPWTGWLFDGRADHYAGRSSRRPCSKIRTRSFAWRLMGMVLALARWALVGDEIHCGTLVVAGRAVKYDRSYWLVCPTRAQGFARRQKHSLTGYAPKRTCSRPRVVFEKKDPAFRSSRSANTICCDGHIVAPSQKNWTSSSRTSVLACSTPKPRSWPIARSSSRN